MKINYICECCDEIIEELEFDDLSEFAEELACLTAEEHHDIMKIYRNGSRVFVKSICDDCITGLGLDDAGGFLFSKSPIIH